MRGFRFAVMALLVLSAGVVASASVLNEGFESYVAGSAIHGQGGWKGWNGDAAAGASVSGAFAYSGKQSVAIAGASDLVHEFDVAGGVWVLSAMQYIPSGGTGTTYFILLNSYDDGANQDWSIQTQYNLASGAITTWTGAVTTTVAFDRWVQLKYVIDLDNNTVDEYYDGTKIDTRQWDDNVHGTIGAIDLFANGASAVYYDDIVLQTLAESQATASAPVPADGAIDVVRDVVLSWTSGSYAASHDVYLGTDATAVSAAVRTNPMGALASQGQSDTAFDPAGLLEFGQTYYWRVDEVNATPDTIFAGPVWTFTTEPFLYPIQDVIATSNTEPMDGAGPQYTVDGSGLDESGLHSLKTTDAWLGMPMGAEPAYIQYEFDAVYKLAEMWVWNYNSEFEKMLGFGLKDVTVEYSEDGAAWTSLGDFQFAQATAKAAYAHNTTVDFAGVSARFVRIVVRGGYGPLGQYGLSEVRFYHKPVRARGPQPADGATGVDVNGTLNWRPGREAASHQVYLSADEQAVIDGTALVTTVAEHQYSPDGLMLGQVYYWRVDEVNAAETVATWPGQVWSFTAQEYMVVDDFESYTDNLEAGEAIFDTWLDGWVNDTGSTVGHINAPFAEQTIVHSGRQSMPLSYDNSSTATSEAELKLSANWSLHGIKSLSLYFYGAAGNNGQLYVKINNTKIPYDGPAINLARRTWLLWSIDLSKAGNVSNVRSLVIGIEGSGAKGILYIDDVRLYPEVLPAVAADITGPGDTVQGVPNDNDWPAAEYPALAIDNKSNTKYLHRKGGRQATGFQVAPLIGSTIVTGLTFTSANDDYGRDPTSFELSGSNASIDGPYTLIASGSIVDFSQATVWPRYTKTTTPIAFENTVAYKFYQIVFPTLRAGNDGNMQIAEVEFIGAPAQ
ncbi:MAG TPA: discoidin domain-containing protein [Sedimentisphaerales bacterium]|nr:discoidin domain-containing protein [Sedimentisphaerales bacterium]HRS10741.1 discoidin domain-containing protein [Sedimentisphaerales bacterium]HRV47446.1 discoidin domain-containing protein [Sedimentisphaerales bacterium]